ncbi:MAG: hypothetical protein HY543_06140 [Deltaproteobacteria bacterium]|nr:hypothetical protein [Deltaproteobacteria bacterium]
MRNQRGQSATEYALLVAVVVLGILAAVSFLLPKIEQGSETLGKNLLKRLEVNPITKGVDGG